MSARHLHSDPATPDLPRVPKSSSFHAVFLVAAIASAGPLVACGEDDDGGKNCPDGTVLIGGDCVSTGDTDATDTDTVSPDTEVTDTDTTDPETDTITTVSLPFAIDDWFVPSGFFPAGEATNIVAVDCPTRPAGAMGTCHGFTWTPAADGFAGVWWQYPEGNWGEAPGLEVPAGATAITFTAWGKDGGETVEFLSGYASDGYERKSPVITLTTTPTEYTLFLTGATYTDIAGAFGWVTTSKAGSAVTVYIDDIVMNGALTGAGCTDPAATNYDPEATVDDGSCTYDEVALPLVVDDWYGPSGYFPEGEANNIDATGTCPNRAAVGAVGMCHAFTWTPGAGTFAGVWWQFPDGNWGEAPGLPIAAGATSVSFWAWGKDGGEKIDFLAGYASDGFERRTGVITLTTTPTMYEVDLAGATYTDVAGGFGWVAADGAVTFYVDGITWNGPVAGAGCTDPTANNYDAEATSDDGSCIFNVTFSVDMSCSGETVTSPVSITGPFCSWCAEGYELSDTDADGVWTGTFPFPEGNLEFKYMANAFAIQENLIGDACAPVTDGVNFANRQVSIGGVTTLSHTWGQCTACGGTTLSQVSLPITFDSPTVDYTMVDFGGAATTIVNDPTNASNKVARTVKPASAELWAGTTTSTNELGLASRIPFTAQARTMTVRVYSPDAGVPVRLKVEDKADATKTCETEAVTTVANAWETLTFDFGNEAPGTAELNLNHTFNKASIFFNFGTTGAAAGEKVYLWDDVAFGGGGGDVSGCTDAAASNYDPNATVDDGSCVYEGAAIVLRTFDDAAGLAGWTRVADANSAEATLTWSADGQSGGAMLLTASNTSTAGKAYIFQYDATGVDYGGATSVRLTFDLKVSTSLTGAALHLQTNVPGVGVVNTFDIQNQGLNPASWTTYSYDFDGVNAAATTFSMHFNMASGAFVGAGGAILVDNVRLEARGGQSLAQVSLPITFDDSGVDYTVVDFGGAVTTLVEDPTNAANMVARTVKPVGAELWAGTTMSTNALGLAARIPFTASNKKMSVRVYSPNTGVPVRLKVEDKTDGGKSVETEAVTTVANAWETLEFDFGNQVAGTAALNLAFNYDKASIFFNFGTTGAQAGEKVYLWDDVMFVGGGGGNTSQVRLPITFDEAGVDYSVVDFGGASTTLVADPTNASNMVARTVKGAGAELWAGTTMSTSAGLAVAIPIAANATTMSVRVYSPNVGVPVRLKIETVGDPTRSVETEAVTTVANTWQTLVFNFANQAPGTAALNLTYTYNMASIFFNFGTTGAVAGEKVYLWDDVRFGTN